MSDPLTPEQVESILGKWSDGLDLCTDDAENFTYVLATHQCNKDACADLMVDVPDSRRPSTEQKARAAEYIAVLARPYPFQLRRAFALWRYHIFLDVYASGGRTPFAKAMRAI